MSDAAHYREHGYVLLPRFVAPDLAHGLFAQATRDLAEGKVTAGPRHDPLLNAGALHIYGHRHPPLRAFHWGMTPAIAALAGCDLVPTYCLLRVYQRDAICKVHGDRPACEHSVSLMLEQSDGIAWPLEVARSPSGPGPQPDDWDHASLPMSSGDAVLYRGISHRHGRITPNPNAWSAHLFLHWVDRNGPHAAEAHDGRPPPELSAGG